MKKLIIAMSIIAITISSCSKHANLLPNNDIASQSDLLQTDATHFYHGTQVTHQSEITSFNSNESVTIMTNNINGTLQFYYFDNETEEINFLQQTPSLQSLYAKALQTKEMRAYAVSSGEVEHFKLTGVVSQDYMNYLEKFKTRGGYTLRSGLNATGLALFIPGPTPQIFLPMDNNAESFTGANAIGFVFRDPLYAGGALGIAMAPGLAFVNLPLAWRNIITSAN